MFTQSNADRLVLISLLCAGLLVVVANPLRGDYFDAVTPKPYISLLQGAWDVVIAEHSGEDITKNLQQRGLKIIFEGNVWKNRIDGHLNGTAKSSQIRLYPWKTPMEFDHIMTTAAPERMQITMPGIYKLENDTLTNCFSKILTERPKTFATAHPLGNQSDFYLLTLKRDRNYKPDTALDAK